MEHCFFGNNIKSKMGIFNLNQIYILTKNPNQKYFFEVYIRFHKCWDRMEFLHSYFYKISEQ